MPSWDEKLAVGHASIDGQHRALFEHADRLLEAMREHRAGEEIERLLVFLREYCRSHFAMEEGLMAANLYPRVAAHVAQHREFQRRFKAIEDQVAARGATPGAILDLKDLVRNWLRNHISEVDIQLAGYLNRLPHRGDALARSSR